ncbi:GldG family protein [Candidatus Shapirobacteria bacterium]|nr:GldG family protein [Candidatus Shapirobacteria bacterium]
MKKIISFTTTLLFLTIIIGVNLGVYQLPDLKIDLSANKINSLSNYTTKTINNIDGQVEMVVYASNNLPGEARPVLYGLRAILKSMETVNKSKFKLTIIDPSSDDKAKADVAKYGIKELQFSSIKNDKFEVQKGYFGLVMKYKEKYEVLPVAGDVGNLEYLLVSGIKRLTSTAIPILAFYEDEGTVQSGIQYLKKYLEGSYKVVEVALDGDKEFPTEASGLVIVGRSTKIDDKGITKLVRWIDSGRPTVAFVDRTEVNQNMVVTKTVDTGLEKIFEDRGMKMNSGLISSPKGAVASFKTQTGSFLVQYPYWLQINSNQIDSSNPTLSGINSLLIPWASNIEVNNEAKPLFWVDNSTLDDSVSDVSPASLKKSSEAGKRYVVGAVRSDKLKLAVISDKDFVTDQFVVNSQQNLALALNLIDYMSGDSGIFEIRNKVMSVNQLREVPDNIKNVIKYGNMAVPVLLLVGVYFLTQIRRSRRLKTVIL